jgi:peptidoglycan/LPS O-acetylase OafA/YrhL
MQKARETGALYYPSFDYLRIVLATTVAVGHSGISVWAHTGNLSVQVFFAMSGWLIGNILLRYDPRDLPRFYFNRAARIWIPYFVAILLLITVSLLKDPVTGKWLEFIFYKVTFVYNFFGPPQLATFKSEMPLEGTGNHFWSICAEEQFYLLAPFLLTVIPARVGKSIWFWIAIAAIATTSVYWDYFGSISLGVLAAVVRRRLGDWQGTQIAKLALTACAAIALTSAYMAWLSYQIAAPCFAVSLVLLLAQPGHHSPIAVFLGGISYPMYLNHWIGSFASSFLFKPLGLRDSLVCQISGVVISLMIASALYLAIDLQVKQNRDKYFTGKRGTIAAAVGFGLVTTGLIGGMIFI